MKKILLSFVIALTAMSVRAQEIDSLKSNQVNVDTLTAKINQLQHDYDLLVCKFELSQLNLKLDNQSNNLNISTNGILINCYNSNFNRKLYTSYKENYMASIEWYESHKKAAKTVISFVLLKTMNANFTESEIEELMSSIKVIESGLSRLESALNYYEVVLNMYRDL